MSIEKKPILSISMLVSNRIDTIRKCMESIKPLLTEIPCELVAVDTVGEATDGSIDVVREYTDKIYRFEWCNDFAKARNFGLDRCSGEWFMFMDDDEWFEDITEIVEFFKSGEYKKYNCANYKIRSYTNKEGAYSSAALFRMVKREKETRFVSRVHEHIQPVKVPVKEFSAFIHHYGYAFETDEERFAHSERNIRLLLPEFQKNPWDMHNRAQLVQEYLFMDEYQKEALELCEETLKGNERFYKTNEFQWILSAYVRIANKADDFKEVVKRAELVRKKFPLSALADLSISIIEVNARFRAEQYKEGVAVMEHALKLRQYLLENSEVKHVQMILDFATFLEEDAYGELLRVGIRCCRKIQRDARAEELNKERFRVLKKPVLTVSLLVSNRKNAIRACLESIRPLLEAVPSELIVVDTVGEADSDGSLSIAKEYTDHIVPFVWCDDFAVARNAGLQEAKGDWFLYLDDDEWFEKTEELQSFFLSGEYLDYSSATYLVRNYKDKEGMQYSTEVVGRAVRRGKNTRFVGCVHEAFSELYLPNKELSDYVHHYGFVYSSEEEKAAHMRYVYELMQKDLIKNPTNFRNRIQLTAVLAKTSPAEAKTICRETLELCREKRDNIQYQWQIAILFSLMESLQSNGEEAAEYFEWLKTEELMSIEAEQLACYRMTRIWIINGQYAKAYPYAKQYFELAELVEQKKDELSADFQKYQIPEYYIEMLKLGGFCAWQAKAYMDAWILYGSIPWEVMDSTEEDTLLKIFAMAEEYSNETVLFHIIKRVMTNEQLKPTLGTLMQNPQVKNRIQSTLTSQRNLNNVEEKIKLSISLLVSNRKDTIRKCLESIRPLLQNVSSELIIVDTVGEENSDGSLSIVKEYTDKIIHFDWCNDFAAARNAGLEKAHGEWFMFLDDDEWFESVDELIDFFNSEQEKEYNSASYCIRNYQDKEGRCYSTATLGRIVRRTKELCFTGAIHETFSQFRLPCKEFSSFVHHFGYVYKDEEEKRQHIQRNIALLKEELAKNPQNLRYRAQMAMELATFDNESAMKLCEETIALCKMEKSCPEFQWILSLKFRLYEALGTKPEEAEEEYYALKQAYGYSETAENAISAQLARIYLIHENYAKAQIYAEKYLEGCKYLKENREIALLQMTADFARYQEENYYLEMLHYAAFCAWKTRKYELAWEHYASMPWEKEGYQNEEALWKIFAMAEECENKGVLQDILLRLKSNKAGASILDNLMKNRAVYDRIQKLSREKADKTVVVKIPPRTNDEILVTVSLLVSNRKDTIRKCLDSIKPLLDMVPSELIAIDTVGEENSDGSLDIVKEYTNNIIHFDWCNDFAAARNVGLKAASGKWFMTLDDDEWFEDVTPIILFFLEGDYKRYDRAWYIVRNYLDINGKQYSDGVVDRMCRITPEMRYEGRIHECLMPQAVNVMQFFCYVHHYGYAYTDKEAKEKHTARNLTLLEEEIKSRPDDLRMNCQMIQEYCIIEQYEKAEEICRRMLLKNIQVAKNPFVQYFAVMQVRIMGRKQKWMEVIAKYKEISEQIEWMEVPKLICLGECVSALGEVSHYEELICYAWQWLEQRERIKELGDAVLVQEIFDYRIYLTKEYMQQIIKYGIYGMANSEKYELLSEFLHRVDWTDEKEELSEHIFLMTDIYGKTGNGDWFFPYAEQIIKNLQLKKELFASLQRLVLSYPQRKEEVSAWLDKYSKPKAKITSEVEKLAIQLKQNIRDLIAGGDVSAANELIQGLKELVPDDEELIELENQIK